MRVLTISDLHICLSSRWREGQRVHTWIVDEVRALVARDEGPELIIVCGDIYERTPNPEEVMEAVRLFCALTASAPVVILRGNHDPRHAIDVFACLDTPHPVTCYDQPAVHVFPGGALAVVPWLDHVGPATTRRMTKEERDVARSEALVGILDTLGAELAKHDGVRLAAAHCVIRGSKISKGQPLKKGQEFEVALEDLGRLGADVVACGHIHMAQGWFVGETPVFFIGSTTRTDFGEVETKRVVMIHATPRLGARPRIDIESIQTPAAPMILAENGWTGSGWASPLDALTAGVTAARASAPLDVAPEVRFLYTVAAEHREAARFAAAAVKLGLEGIGAVVTARPIITVTRAARCPEIAQAPALTDKLELWLEEVRDIPPSDPRALRVQDALAELERTLALRTTTQAGGVHLRRLTMAGFGSFKREVTLDLDDLPGPIVAMTGENGHGKSTLCAAWGAAMYRKVATDHGSYLVDRYVTAPDGFLEAVVDVAGAPHTLRQDFGAGEASVTLPDGSKVDGRKMKSSFDRWVADTLLPSDVRQAAFDAVQADDGILKQKRGARKKTFLQALGVGALTKVWKAAQDRANKEAGTLAELGFRLEDKRKDAAKYPADLEAQGTAAREALARAETAHAAARTAEIAYQAAVVARRAAEGRRAEHRDACDRRDRILAQRADLVAIVGDAPAIREAVTRVAEIDAAIAVVTGSIEAARVRAESFDRDADRAGLDAVAARERATAHRRTAERARGHLAARESVLAAVASLPALLAAVEDTEGFLAAAVVEVTAAEKALGALETLGGEGERARRDATSARERAAIARAAEARAVSVLSVREGVLAAVTSIRSLRNAVETAESDLAAAEADVATLRDRTEHAGGQRITALREGLGGVLKVFDILPAHDAASTAIRVDDALVQATNGEAMVAALQRVTTARAALATARTALGVAERQAVQMPAMDRAEQDRAAAARAITAEEATATARESEHAAIAARIVTGRAAGREAVDAAKGRATDRRQALTAARSALTTAQTRAAEAPAVARAEEELALAERGAGEEDARAAAADVEQRRLALVAEEARAEGDAAAATRGGHRTARAPHAVVAGRQEALVRAEASLAALAAPLAAAEAAVEGTAVAALEELPLLPEHAPDAVARAVREEREGAAIVARLDEQTRAWRVVAAEVAALEAKHAEAAMVAATWDLLAQAFGPDGIQALEIDAACPALSELATGYLHRHFGPRWSMRVDTQEDEAGEESGAAGVLNINVYDAEEGRRGDILFFSPGERAFLGRAFAGALAFMVANRTGATDPTLLLDETAGAVSPGNLQPYMGMIRGIAEDIGATRVILVVQSPALAALADSVIHVERGEGGSFFTVRDPSGR